MNVTTHALRRENTTGRPWIQAALSDRRENVLRWPLHLRWTAFLCFWMSGLAAGDILIRFCLG